MLDKTMIGLCGSGMDQVGFYTNAQKIVKVVLTIVTALGTVMLPAMSSAFAEGKKNEIVKSIELAFRFIFLLAFALFFGLIAISKRFVPLFFGDGYDLVVPLIIVISPILIIIGVSNVIGKQFLLPTKQQGAYTISIIAGAGVNFILNIILIHFFDAIGASIATVIAELVVALVQMWHVRKQLPLRVCLKPFWRYLIEGFIMFLVVWGIGKILPSGIVSLFVMIFVGISVYILELTITKDRMFQSGIKIIERKRRIKVD